MTESPPALGIIEMAVAQYRPRRIFALFSGGHDSVVATHLATSRDPAINAVHIDTGTGLSQNFAYVQERCQQFGWKLEIYGPPKQEDSYEQMVIAHGFPGPAQHQKCYIKLKERQLLNLVRVHKQERFGKIMLISGVRNSESARRMGYDEPIHRDGAVDWGAPLLDFSPLDIT